MPLSFTETIAIIAVIALCTFITRVIPFAIFGGNKKLPETVEFLGKMLPPAIIAILVIYCLKTVSLSSFPHGLPEFIAMAIVVTLHLWKRNALLSIGIGTACYMFLVQVVFV